VIRLGWPLQLYLIAIFAPNKSVMLK